MATKIYANARFGLREDTLENWTANNPVLERGEPAAVRDGSETEWLKIGDGVTPFNDLPWKKGPKGDKGETGEQGVKGEKGDKGEKGEDADLTYINNTFAGSLKGTATGEVIRLDDVSPVEHEVNVTLESVNLAVPNGFVVENNGMTATTNPDGTITVTGSVADGTKATLLQLIYRKHEANFIALELGQIYKLVVKKDGTSILTFSTKTVYTDTGEVYWGTVETTDITRPRKVQLVYLQKNVAEGDTSLCGTYTVQLVKGTKVGEYTPCVTDFSTVNLNLYKKQLLPFPYRQTSKESNGVKWVVNDDGSITVSGTPTADSYLVLYNGAPLLNSGFVTISLCGTYTNADIAFQVYDDTGATLKAIYATEKITVNLNEYPTAASWKIYVRRTSNDVEMTGTIYPSVEAGDRATAYELYTQPVQYIPAPDGTVEGVTALSPNMTFITDTAGVTINCGYNRDINAAFAELQQAIISLGGNV